MPKTRASVAPRLAPSDAEDARIAARPRSSAAARMRLHGFAAAWGERLFARLTTLEHEVAACVLAGDNDTEVASYLGVSRSKARRCLLRMVERLTTEARQP